MGRAYVRRPLDETIFVQLAFRYIRDTYTYTTIMVRAYACNILSVKVNISNLWCMHGNTSLHVSALISIVIGNEHVRYTIGTRYSVL